MSERAQSPAAWFELAERGSRWGISTLALVYRALGRTACLAVTAPVILYFFITGAQQRRSSLAYLRRVWAANGWSPEPGLWTSLRHFFAFGSSAIDRFGAWIGGIDRDDLDGVDTPEFNRLRADPRGALFLTAHIGSTEIIRAVATRDKKRPVNVIVHTANAERYNRLIERFAPESQLRLIEASTFGLGSAMRIASAIDRGEWVVVMADRISARSGDRIVEVDFLGERARLPEGPFILATILQCPAHLMLCVGERGRRRAHVSLLREAQPARRGRSAEARELARRYAAAIEGVVRQAPLQWFNFYDFWAPAPRRGPDEDRHDDAGGRA